MDTRSRITMASRRFGENVREARKEAGMAQATLAQALGYRHPTSVGYIEQGRNNVSPETLLRLCRALGKSPNELLGWD